jgi:hypothetical protein
VDEDRLNVAASLVAERQLGGIGAPRQMASGLDTGVVVVTDLPATAMRVGTDELSRTGAHDGVTRPRRCAMHTINQHSMILGLSVMLATAACSHSGSTAEPASKPVVRTKTVETPSATHTTALNPTVGETGSTGNESTYSTRSFGVPFDIAVPTWLRAEPNVEQLN